MPGVPTGQNVAARTCSAPSSPSPQMREERANATADVLPSNSHFRVKLSAVSATARRFAFDQRSRPLIQHSFYGRDDPCFEILIPVGFFARCGTALAYWFGVV